MRSPEDEALRPPLPQAGGMRQVTALRTPAAERASVPERCWVAEEQALFIEVAGLGSYTLMWTRTDTAAAAGFLADDGVLGDQPATDALALTAGFLFTEGMIERMADVAEMAVCPDSPDVVRVRLCGAAPKRRIRQSGFVFSSCGLCRGGDAIVDLDLGLPEVPSTLRIEPLRLQQLMAAMERSQFVFNSTGGTHAAALFTPEGRLITAAEDLGRHNALDKVIGNCLLRGYPTAGCGAILSGRVSLELIVKAARAGIEVVAAVSAPSSLAIQAAQKAGITLCGFVRDGWATTFTHTNRLIGKSVEF